MLPEEMILEEMLEKYMGKNIMENISDIGTMIKDLLGIKPIVISNAETGSCVTVLIVGEFKVLLNVTTDLFDPRLWRVEISKMWEDESDYII